MPQSIGLLLLSLLPFCASFARSRGVRATATWLATGGVAGMLLVAPFPLEAVVGVGDYQTYARDLNEYLGAGVRMEAPLGWALLSGLWNALGRTDAVAPEAFQSLARLFTGVLLTGLNLLAWWDGWSPRLLRYVGLCCAAPSMLLFLGYREFAYLPLALTATALPLILIGVGSGEAGPIVIAFLALGVGASVHAFGLITLVAALLALLAARLPWRVVLLSLTTAIVAWGGWLVLYLAAGMELATGHAGNLDLRQLFHDERVEYVHRIKPGLFTVRGLRDVLAIYIIGGMSVLWALAPALARERSSRELLAVLAITVPCLGAAALIWPIQGLSVDTDIIVGLCPAFFAVAWFAAGRSAITALACWVLLAASHPIFWWVVTSRQFEN